MKKWLTRIAVCMVMMSGVVACSPDSVNQVSTDVKTTDLNYQYTYSQEETELVARINEYRVSVGLKELELINFVSIKSEEHNIYMISNKEVSHAGFVERSDEITKVLGVKNVGENVAYNFKTPESVLKAWLNSPTHKENIEGDFTHFGIAIREDAETGKKYYTNIFVKE